MNTITISKKEYNQLLDYKRLIVGEGRQDHYRTFDTGAFGMWRKRFGTQSSISYVNKLRKSWRK
jgi:hypothetical protein